MKTLLAKKGQFLVGFIEEINGDTEWNKYFLFKYIYIYIYIYIYTHTHTLHYIYDSGGCSGDHIDEEEDNDDDDDIDDDDRIILLLFYLLLSVMWYGILLLDRINTFIPTHYSYPKQ